MTQQHPITPPPELVEKWIELTRSNDCIGAYPQNYEHLVATQAAQWGADQELEACCEWMADETPTNYINALRAARRSKSPSLKEQALDALTLLCKGPNATAFVTCRDTIRRALEQLPDHE